MDADILGGLVANGGVTAILAIALGLVYRAGNFFAPLITEYMQQQVINQANIAKTLAEFSELQKVGLVRLEAIEKRLTLFEGLNS